jgi:hypothetical protein
MSPAWEILQTLGGLTGPLGLGLGAAALWIVLGDRRRAWRLRRIVRRALDPEAING